MLISCSSAFRTKMHVGITPAMHGQHMDDTWILRGEDMARQNKPPTDTCNHEHTNDIQANLPYTDTDRCTHIS